MEEKTFIERLTEKRIAEARAGNLEAQEKLRLRGILIEPNTEPKEREVRSIKGVIIPRAFRPTAEVDSILLQISKGRISKFLNRAVKETYQRDKREEERGR